jgi:REP element-mobilizing transposase RayT
MKNGRRINSYRLSGYDYSQPGVYFVTICTSSRQKFFGEIADCQMRLNMAGIFAERCWQEIPKHFSTVELDEFVIMPNHIHGLIIINHENTQIKTVWQRNFFDHIVRDESELNRIRLYIQQNPSKWPSDRQNKNRLKIVRETESIYQDAIWMI